MLKNQLSINCEKKSQLKEMPTTPFLHCFASLKCSYLYFIVVSYVESRVEYGVRTIFEKKMKRNNYYYKVKLQVVGCHAKVTITYRKLVSFVDLASVYRNALFACKPFQPSHSINNYYYHYWGSQQRAIQMIKIYKHSLSLCRLYRTNSKPLIEN